MEKDICENLKVIPQFTGTCWFNAFLMSVLYSQNARKMMIKVSKKWNKENKFLNILKYILKKNYNDPSIEKYYNKIRPELLLFEYLKKNDIEIEKILKEKKQFDNIYSFGFSKNYFPTFLKFLDKKTLDIYYDKKTNNTIIDFQKHFKIKLNENGDLVRYIDYKPTIFPDSDKNNMIKFIKEDIPNFIILYHSELYEDDLITNTFNYLKKNMKSNADIYDFSSYNIKSNGIKDFKDIITLNDIKYKLDSCLLSNYNKAEHEIVGITCNDNRYVYNGWTLNTNDPIKKNEIIKGDNIPCSLMKFNWDLIGI
jgi:hypothetical protein